MLLKFLFIFLARGSSENKGQGFTIALWILALTTFTKKTAQQIPGLGPPGEGDARKLPSKGSGSGFLLGRSMSGQVVKLGFSGSGPDLDQGPEVGWAGA